MSIICFKQLFERSVRTQNVSEKYRFKNHCDVMMKGREAKAEYGIIKSRANLNMIKKVKLERIFY